MKSLKDVLRGLEKAFDARAYLERFSYKDHGDNVSVTCPLCGRDDKLWVLVTGGLDRPPGTWICYYCDEAGGPLSLVKLLENCDLFSAAALMKEFSVATDRSGDVHAAVEKILAALPQETAAIEEPECELPPGFVLADEALSLPRYFTQRGISRALAVRHGLGFCASGPWKNRLIVPVYRAGRLAWFLGRWMAKKPPRGKKKYLNSPGARSSEDLYAIEHAAGRRRVVLVEDVFSSMKQGAGVVATFGTHFSRRQLALLAETDAEEVVVAWDPDALEKAWELAMSLSTLWRVRVAELPGVDPDEMDRPSFRRLVASSPAVDGASALSGLVRARLGVS